jgi:hypothetical protein
MLQFKGFIYLPKDGCKIQIDIANLMMNTDLNKVYRIHIDKEKISIPQCKELIE